MIYESLDMILCITDYVGFIKKVMKQLQNARYVLIQRTDVDLRQLDECELLAAAPGDQSSLLASTLINKPICCSIHSFNVHRLSLHKRIKKTDRQTETDKT